MTACARCGSNIASDHAFCTSCGAPVASGAVVATAAAGWYPDPSGSPTQRYFDGTHWTQNTTAAPAPSIAVPVAPPAGPESPPLARTAQRRDGVSTEPTVSNESSMGSAAAVSDYNFFTIIDASDDDDALYPVLSGPGDSLPVEITQDDGQIAHFRAARALVQQSTTKGLTSVISLPDDIKWEILITDTRVIVYCTKFDKGGGWTGMGAGAVFALAANAVSKARAAHRRKGKVLVAHIRYPWIAAVGGSPKEGWRSAENLRFKVDAQPRGQGHRHLYLTLVLPKQLDAASIAYEVGRRCARYRLANDDSMEPEEHAKFVAIATGPQKTPAASDPGKPRWSWYEMPTSYRVNATTARPKAREHTSPAAGPAPAQVSTPTPTAPAPAPTSTAPAGWYPDPSGAAAQRYFDGTSRTAHTS